MSLIKMEIGTILYFVKSIIKKSNELSHFVSLIFSFYFFLLLYIFIILHFLLYIYMFIIRYYYINLWIFLSDNVDDDELSIH